jgi:hypothetical protein
MKKVVIALISLFGMASSLAQAKEEKAYRKESEEIRQSVWAWNDPKFKVRDIPQKYAKASKVIIAYHVEFEGDAKKYINRQFKESFSEIVRQVIKLNDRSAVDEFSELSFTMLEKTVYGYSKESSKTFVGVRVIKPDGKVQEIDADEIVLTKKETDEKKARLAIPDLQPGDILDFFIATTSITSNTFNRHNYTIFFAGEAPIINYSLHGQVGGKYAIQYMECNQAPPLRTSKNEEGDIIFDVTKTDIPQYESQLWVIKERQLPFIRIKIFVEQKAKSYSPVSGKAGSIHKLTNSNEVTHAMAKIFSSKNVWQIIDKGFYKTVVSDTKKIAEKSGHRYEDMSVEEKAELLFYVYRFYNLLSFDVDEILPTISMGMNKFDGESSDLYSVFWYADLNSVVIFGDDRLGFRMNEVMNTGELFSAVAISNNLFFINSIYDIPFTVPLQIEGASNTNKVTFEKTGRLTMVTDDAKLFKMEPSLLNLPVTTSNQNAHIEKLVLSVSPDKILLETKRTAILKGYHKNDVQKNLLLYEDLYEYERVALKQEKSLIQELERDKTSKKLVPEIKNAFAEARKKHADAVVKEAEEWFEQEVTDLKDFKIISPGIRHTSPDFIYSSSFNLNGLIKKAGNNIIVEIGKIQGKPLTVKEEQRNRTLDVYMPFARSIEYEIELEIPEDYTAEGVDALNTKVENETGYFITEATSNGKTVSIKIKKHYLHNFEPAANFSKLMAFMDASSNWTNAKLLLKKK